jgi:hypothetical protein
MCSAQEVRTYAPMRDITEFMSIYRECSRNLWNAYFSTREDSGANWDAYEGIRKLLFDALVVNELFFDESQEGEPPPPLHLRVVPLAAKVPILIRRPSSSGRYWDQVRDMMVGPDEIELTFVDYYDFREYPIKDFRHFLCKILSFPQHKEYEGLEALIDALDGRVYHNEQGDDPPKTDQ